MINNCFEETLAGVFEEFKGELEIAIRAVVGIRHGLLAWVMTQIVAHADDLLKIRRRIGLTGDVVIVLLIHHGDIVEARKVLRRELAGSMIEVITMPLTTLAHTTVWQLPHVPRANASRINQKLILQTPLCHQMAHNPVSRWRATDITQTDKQYLLHFACKDSNIWRNEQANSQSI